MLAAGLGETDYEDFEPVRIKDPGLLQRNLGDPSTFATNIDRPLHLKSELKLRRTILAVILTTENHFTEVGSVISDTVGDCCDDMLFFVESTTTQIVMADKELNVVIFPKTKFESRKMYYILKFLMENHIKTHDFFYIAKDYGTNAFTDSFHY